MANPMKKTTDENTTSPLVIQSVPNTVETNLPSDTINKLKEAALKKYKVTVTNNDPKESANLTSVYVSVANAFFTKSYVLPFGIPVNGVEQCVIDNLKEITFPFTTESDVNPGLSKTTMRPKYTVVVEPYVEE